MARRYLEDELIELDGRINDLSRRSLGADDRISPMTPSEEVLGSGQRIIIKGETYYIDLDGYAYLAACFINGSRRDLYWDQAYAWGALTKEPTGFANRTDSTLSFNDGNRTLSITGTYDIYIYGVKTTKTNDSIQITNTNGLWYIYYNASGVLTASQTAWDIPTTVQVATVYWNGTTGLIGEERHGLTMDSATHRYLHVTRGAVIVPGGFAGVFTNPTAWTVAAGYHEDEDITNTIAQQTQTRVFYRSGTNYTYTAKQSNLYTTTGGNLAYDPGTGLAAADVSKHVAYWVFATNDPACPIYTLVGQRQDSTIADARANNTYSGLVLLTLPFQEMKVLYRVILQRTAGGIVHAETADYRDVQNMPGGTYVATLHSALSGLLNDDHTQYILADGTRAFTGNVGMGTAAIAGAHLYVYSADIATTTGWSGVASIHSKTTGASDYADSHYIIDNRFTFNQSGGEIGESIGIYNLFRIDAGSIGAVGNVKTLWGLHTAVDLNGGTCTNDVYSGFFYIDQEAGNTITGKTYGLYVGADLDGTTTDTTYLAYFIAYSGLDFGIYQTGTSTYGNYFADKIGIGTNTPQTVLHLWVAGAASYDKTSYGDMVIEQSSNIVGAIDKGPSIAFRSNNNIYNPNYNTTVGLIRTGKSNATNYTDTSPHYMAFHVANTTGLNERMRLTSDGYLGIGTDSPDSGLHVMTASAGSVAAASGTILTLERSVDNYLSFLTPNNKVSGILFGDPEDNDIGAFYYNHSDNSMVFGVNTSTALTIASTLDATFAGNIYVATAKSIGISSGGRLLFTDAATDNIQVTAANLAIGSVTPDCLLHVWAASAGTVAAQTNTLLALENSDNALLSILTPNNKYALLAFGDPDDNDIGYLKYDHSSNVMSLKANAKGIDLKADAVNMDYHFSGQVTGQAGVPVNTNTVTVPSNYRGILVVYSDFTGGGASGQITRCYMLSSDGTLTQMGNYDTAASYGAIGWSVSGGYLVYGWTAASSSSTSNVKVHFISMAV